jgi:flagellar M-ring protein FliF
LNVVNSPFAGTEKETIPEETLVEKAQKYAVSNPVVIAKYVIGGILLLYMFFGVLRPMLKRLTSKSSASSTSEEAPSAAEQAAQTPSEPPMTAGNARTYEQKLGVAKKLASEDPKMVANVVKGWVNDE